ncbi:hypothetical protein CVD27_10660 [Neobacillus cucumis]|uniref:Uncharacterized protein n=1 Tax=Neobacillus cucumis TaxID=1740721 RepID=A0A2N5HIW8_9BACI|nr:hypothetical protein CVD27_10660 [Neobacillus cucumis]
MYDRRDELFGLIPSPFSPIRTIASVVLYFFVLGNLTHSMKSCFFSFILQRINQIKVSHFSE